MSIVTIIAIFLVVYLFCIGSIIEEMLDKEIK